MGAPPSGELVAASAATAVAVPLRRDAATIGLIGLAHGTSHFFHMLLPPLFLHFALVFPERPHIPGYSALLAVTQQTTAQKPGSGTADQAPASTPDPSSLVQRIPLASIKPNPYQPRKEFRDEELADLEEQSAALTARPARTGPRRGPGACSIGDLQHDLADMRARFHQPVRLRHLVEPKAAGASERDIWEEHGHKDKGDE